MAGFGEILKHSGNYLVANLATRALAFISIPVYTRLLSTDDYGITAVFLATVGILNTVLSLNFDASIGRYYYDRASDKNFKTFVGTSVMAVAATVCLTSAVLYGCSSYISEWNKLPIKVVYLLAPMAVLNIVGGIFMQIYQPQKKSRPVAFSSLIRVYLGFAFSIGLIFIFRSEKYLGQILGQILAGGVMLFYWCRCIVPYVTWRFSRQHLKYIFHFSIPLIPYALSGVIIEQFGKLTVAAQDGMSQAGFYSLSVSIASLTAIVTEITHQAWYPYYMEYMKSRDYDRHDRDLVRIFKLTLIAAMFFSCFGREIGLILAQKKFTSALHLVPIIALGYVCHQLSYAYMRNLSFALKTRYMSVIVISAGCVNLLLNAVMIPYWGNLGAAVAVMLSYAVMAALSWFFSTRIVKVRGIPVLKLLQPLSILLLFLIPLVFIYRIPSFGVGIAVKILLFIVAGCVLAGKDRGTLITAVRKYVRR